MAALLATAGPATDERPYALVPAFTFAATAAAAERCGYRTIFADIDAESWMLDPDRCLSHRLLDRIGVVVPVGPLAARWRKRGGSPFASVRAFPS